MSKSPLRRSAGPLLPMHRQKLTQRGKKSPYSSYRILSADCAGITLWKLQGDKPRVIQQWTWQNLSLQKAAVSVTTARTFDDLQLTDRADQSATELVLYPPVSGVFSRPIADPDLNDIIRRWQQKQPKIGINDLTASSPA